MAQTRCEGLDVSILLEDYRDLNDQFDRIVSVGMFEHVGPKTTTPILKSLTGI
nr:class I SAM-dependent methyltransferase [Salmonella enterica]